MEKKPKHNKIPESSKTFSIATWMVRKFWVITQLRIPEEAVSGNCCHIKVRKDSKKILGRNYNLAQILVIPLPHLGCPLLSSVTGHACDLIFSQILGEGVGRSGLWYMKTLINIKQMNYGICPPIGLLHFQPLWDSVSSSAKMEMTLTQPTSKGGCEENDCKALYKSELYYCF